MSSKHTEFPDADTRAYETPSLAEWHVDMLALAIVQLLDELPVGVARKVLRRADFWIDAVQRVNCRASEFQQAVAALRAASPEAI
jgi:hypothetical protein